MWSPSPDTSRANRECGHFYFRKFNSVRRPTVKKIIHLGAVRPAGAEKDQAKEPSRKYDRWLIIPYPEKTDRPTVWLFRSGFSDRVSF